MNEERVPRPGDFYRHFKNNLYQIVALATHSETNEKMVIYQALYGNFEIFARPLTMFLEETDHIKYPQASQKYRFEKIEKPALDPINPKAGIKEIEKKGTPSLMDFLDAGSYKQKIEILMEMHKKIDAKTIDNIAASLDVVIEEGDLETRYESLLKCLSMMGKFECTRLR